MQNIYEQLPILHSEWQQAYMLILYALLGYTVNLKIMWSLKDYHNK